MQTNIKSLILGAILALAGVCAGEGLAHADCLEGAARGYNCEVIELRDGSFEASCDEVEHDIEARACSAWAGSFEADGIGETGIEGMYEACMVVALHTGAVR